VIHYLIPDDLFDLALDGIHHPENPNLKEIQTFGEES
jgi:hypothetical protein